MNTTIKSSAINYGLYLGGVLSLATVLSYAVNLDLFTKWWYGVGLMVLIIIFGIVSAVKSKKILAGFISFKEAFSSYFITIAIGLIISTIIGIVIFNFIDPEAAVTLQEKILDTTVEMMRNFGAPEDAIAEAVEKMEAEENMFSIGNTMWSFAKQIIGFSIIGLIAALIIKKSDENA